MKAKLIVNNETEAAIEDGIVAIGRAPDNTIPLEYDSNVSRYHIEIETRGEEFWLVELGSSNGTTVNGEKVYDERKLADGDVILLGGTSEIIFELEKESKSAAAPKPSAEISQAASSPAVSVPPVSAPSAVPAAPIEAAPSKMPTMLIVMGAVCGIALIAVVVAVAVSLHGAGKCQAKVSIANLENNATISKETEVEVASEDDDCAAKAVFYIDGNEFANVTDKPFKATFDPSDFPETDDDFHSLKVELEDENGEKIAGASEVQLIFQTLISASPTPTPDIAADDKPTPKPTVSSGKTASAAETQTMIQNLLGEFRGVPVYKLDLQFVQEVQKKTGEYAADGFFSRAQNYEVIKTEYNSAGLDIPLGYVLAMSRTQFKVPSAGGAEEGLWRMNTQLVTTNGYNGACGGGEALSDAKQNCAAKASALYLKSVLVGVFNNDLIYAVAAFGMPPGDAANWKNTLPANRADFWNIIKTPAQRDAVVRFCAAGIVAENPSKFGLKKDAPLSSLYRNYLVK